MSFVQSETCMIVLHSVNLSMYEINAFFNIHVAVQMLQIYSLVNQLRDVSVTSRCTLSMCSSFVPVQFTLFFFNSSSLCRSLWVNQVKSMRYSIAPSLECCMTMWEKRYVPTKEIFWLFVPLPDLIQEFSGYPHLQFMSSLFLAFNPEE